MNPPCSPWATEADLCPPYTDLDGLAGDLTMFFDMATEVLYDLTEGAYPGVCEHVTRPPAFCGCRTVCRCGSVSEIRLPDFPVLAVSQVLIDGVALPADRYRVDNSALLVLMPQPDDLMRTWPARQRLDLPTTADDTWQVTYTAGAEPPVGGVHACAVLAAEFAMSCNPELRDRCQLPKGTVSSSAKGRTVAMTDPAQLAERGEVGLPMVDNWIRADRWKRKHTGGGAYDSQAPVFRSVYT